MTDEMDGLAALTAKRSEKRPGRTLPPSRNPPRIPSAVAPKAELATASREEVGGSMGPATAESPARKSPEEQESASNLIDTQPLEKASIYLDPPSDDFLESVRITGRRSKPRVDASRSAVVRLALARLSEQMAPDQVVRELVARAPVHSGEGRRRY